jgi:hypothetical protein
MKRQKKSKRVNWEYCECGCHGHELLLGPLYYWMFNDLGRGGSTKHFHLNTRHSDLGDHLGSFSSFEEADSAARAHAKSVLKKSLEELDRAEASVR